MNEPRSSRETSEGGERMGRLRSHWRLVAAAGAAIALVAVLVAMLAGRDGDETTTAQAVRGPDGRWTAGYIIAC